MSESENTAAPVEPVLRFLRPALAALLTFGSLAWSADLYRMVGLALFLEQFLSGMLGIGLALVFLHYPADRKTERRSVPWYDLVAAALGFGAAWYVAITFPDLSERFIEAPTDGLIASAIIVVLCIEGLRRAVGYSLVVIVLVFVAYALVGHLVPGDLQTREVQLDEFITYLGLDNNALFGLAMVVATTIVVTFIFFGQLLLRSGGANFFNDVSLTLMGRYRGGSAKIAITASSLFGSVSGIAVSNIVATGVVTIPMMKRSGFSPKLSAAVEAVASTGGQLMPPVMGAVAFLMADFLELPYREIVIAAIVPSLLYYVSLFIQADLEAAKTGITRVEESEIPRARAVLWAGWLYILPFVGLIFALFTLNWEAETAAILAAVMIVVLFGDWLVFAAAVTLLGVYYAFNWNGVTAAVVGGSLAISIVLRLIYRGKWMSAKDIWQAFVQTGLSVLDILMIVAGAGFIIGVLQVTGLGFAFTLFVVEFGGGNLFLMLVISGLLCIVLGMGMPTVGVYILLAILIAPSLVEVGIDPLAAHMFILYLGMMSLITPPVAVAAFFAASIAKAPPMATGWTCMRFGWTAYVVPFLFVFSPSLLLQGDSPVDLVIDVSSAIAGVWLATAALVGYFARPLDAVHRALYGTAGVLLLIPQGIASWALWTDAAGLVLGVFLVYRDHAETRRLRRASASA